MKATSCESSRREPPPTEPKRDSQPTYKVDGAEAAVADLAEVGEELLGVVPEEELCHVGVLQAARPQRRRHPARLRTPPTRYLTSGLRRSRGGVICQTGWGLRRGGAAKRREESEF